MAKIYRVTDKISYKVGELEIKLSPLSVADKLDITNLMFKAQEGDTKAMMDGSIYSLQCTIKAISGLTDSDGNEYKLQFENGKLSRECVEDLLNIEQSNTLIALCSSFVGGIPNKLPHGVELSGPKS